MVRYAVSFFLTLRVLFRECPDLVFTLNQPAPLLLAVFLHSRLRGSHYILDSHSAPFNDPRLVPLRPFYRFIAVRALLNINTNTHHRELVRIWGGRSFLIGDVPIEFDNDYPRKSLSHPSVAVVASFMFDEPLEAVWSAARLLPDVNFHVTGNYRKAPRLLIRNKPGNVFLEGFLSREDYLGLLLSASAVMALTTRNYTMQMGGYEALSLERPIITSDWPILRDSFGNAAVYVDNSPEGIAAGVRKLVSQRHRIERNASIQRRKRRIEFERVHSQIMTEIFQRIPEHAGHKA